MDMQATPYTTSLTRATHLRARRQASKRDESTMGTERHTIDSAGAGNNHKLNTKKSCRWLVSDGAEECVNKPPP